VLHSRNVALAPVGDLWTAQTTEVFEMADHITESFAYIRWLSDLKGIEKQIRLWDKAIIDQSAELREWVDVCNKIQDAGCYLRAR
jgi:hypothetical protein